MYQTFPSRFFRSPRPTFPHKPLGSCFPSGTVRECPLEALFTPAPAPEEAAAILSSFIVCLFWLFPSLQVTCLSRACTSVTNKKATKEASSWLLLLRGRRAAPSGISKCIFDQMRFLLSILTLGPQPQR